MIYDRNNIPDIKDIYERFIENHSIYKSQESNKFLYYKRTKQMINILIKVIIISPIQD